MSRLLRHWLTLSLTVLVVLPLMMVTVFLLVFLIPQLQTRVETESRVLTEAVTTEVDTFLIAAASSIERLGKEIAALPIEDPSIAHRLDTLATTDQTIEILYLLNAEGQAMLVGLKPDRRPFREDFYGFDFSARNYVQQANRSGAVTWSNTYLSTRGEMSVAVAIPSRGRTLVAEMNLQNLSAFMRRLTHQEKLVAMLIDRNGFIVAHPDPGKSLRQESVGNNSLVSAALGGQTTTGRVDIDGIENVGTATPIPGLGWVALVVQPASVAFAAQRTILYTLVTGTLFALLVALIAALLLARSVARRINDFGDSMQAVANGNYQASIPRFRITEFNRLADSMRRMASALLERESRLQHSEEQYRGVVESTDDLIIRVDHEGYLQFVNHASQRYWGQAPEFCLGLLIFDFVHPDDRESTRGAFSQWLAGDLPTMTWENRQLSRTGQECWMQWNITVNRAADGHAVGFTGIARDISVQRESEKSLRLAASVFNSSAEGIFVTDANKRIISVNPTMVALSGYTSDELIGQTPTLFRSGRHDRSFYRAMTNEVDTAGHWRGEIWNRRKSGEVYPEWLTVTAVKDASGAVVNYIGSFFDISDRKDAEEHIQFLAHHDALTQLPNRTLLEDRIRQAIVTSRRNGSHTVILMLDLDRFKLINDTLGHDVGDRLLVSVARRLSAAVGETETVARLGGDEFIILVPNMDSIDEASTLAQSVLDAISQPHLIGTNELHVTPSIGISIFPNDGDDASALMRCADTAMYHAKNVGRNNFQFFTASMNFEVQERLTIEKDLRRALENQEFLLYYQPQVNCLSGAVTGMEALIRWQHPERGLMFPDDFIRIAEETGLIVPMGEWVLREACRQAKLWHDQGQTNLRMSVNLSARQFQQADLLQQIASALEDSGMNKAMLELEITEGMLMEDPQSAVELLTTLADLGIRLAIDDFGTGYSSLAYLKLFPLHRLKIDKSFIRDISSDPNDAAIVGAVIGLASSLNMEVIAEGVESVDQLRFLEKHGCHEIQGYFFSRPQPARHFTTFSFELPGHAAH